MDQEPWSPPSQAEGLRLSLALAPAAGRCEELGEVASPTECVGGKLLPCLFCDKKFLKWQALGGHQKAHKEERATGWNPYLYGAPPGTLSGGSSSAAAAALSILIASHGGATTELPAADIKLEMSDGSAPLFVDHVLLPAAAAGCDDTVGMPNWGRISCVSAPPETSNTTSSCAGEELDLELRL
ncbi:hypothetical protein BAE44_0001508 [Dichanthelium oligosanthes]|uniref:C2H2-type domain-containing protein n=1 Tax=Dichanthelium oligosanthes TaxID=888268 RepID=A0A1E5WJD2_9POAL|nr:hypothetical protein BAE44_0001508 [Dichanthelium oligosanthes]